MIIAIEVTILTHPLGIYHLVLVRAFGGQTAPSIQVIAVVTHPLCVVLHVCVRASRHRLFRSVPLFHLLGFRKLYHLLILSDSLYALENGWNSALLLLDEAQVRQ